MSGTFDAYLIAQAFGWEWNFTSFFILQVLPILIIIIIAFIVIVRDR